MKIDLMEQIVRQMLKGRGFSDKTIINNRGLIDATIEDVLKILDLNN